MKSSTKLLCIFFIAIFSTSASAKKWRVNNTLSAPDQVDYEELKDAVDDPLVLSGDTIYVEASGVPYEGEIQIYKKLIIIGPGYLLGQGHIQPSVCGSQLSATIGGMLSIYLNEGSDGTLITGLNFDTNPNFSNPSSISLRNTSDITITRNRLEGIDFELGEFDDFNDLFNINITRNLIRSNIDLNTYVNITNLVISNNLIDGRIGTIFSNSLSINISGLVQHNTLTGSRIWIKGCEISYNLVGDITADPAENGAIHHNRLGANNATNMALVDYNPTNIIDPYDDSNWTFDTDDWALDELPDIDTTHGAHNGFDAINPAHPISKANIPAWPAIYECEVQPCGDTTIQVQLKIRVNN